MCRAAWVRAQRLCSSASTASPDTRLAAVFVLNQVLAVYRESRGLSSPLQQSEELDTSSGDRRQSPEKLLRCWADVVVGLVTAASTGQHNKGFEQLQRVCCCALTRV